MALYHSISQIPNPFFSPNLLKPRHQHGFFTSSKSQLPSASSSSTSSNKNDTPQAKKNNLRRAPRPRRRLITLSTSDGRYHGEWNCDYVFSLGEIQLADLAEDEESDAEVLVSLSVHKHAGFGFSVDGRIVTSFNRKCSCCFSSFCREIDTTFNVWVLPSSQSNELQLPEIGGSDPSVIYVKPGSEADLDSVVQDTIRLTASAKDTCSESCEKSVPIWQYTDGKKSYDQRWSRLLEIKNAM